MAELSEYKYYREQLQRLYPSLSIGLIEELSLDWQVLHFPPRAHLIHAGETQAQAFFIVVVQAVSGLWRYLWLNLGDSLCIRGVMRLVGSVF